MIKIDHEKLNDAINTVAEQWFLRELRDALVYSPKLIVDIFGEYQRAVDADKSPEPGLKIFVVAGTYEQYRHFCRYVATGIRMRNNAIYVSGPEVFRGVLNPDVVFYGTWHSRDDIDDIETMIRVNAR